MKSMKCVLIFVAVLTVSLLALMLPLDNGEVPFLKFLSNLGQKKIEIGSIHIIDSNLRSLSIHFPEDIRSWPIYIEKRKELPENDINIRVSLINKSSDDIVVDVREPNSDEISESRELGSEDEMILYEGNICSFLTESFEESAKRPNPDNVSYSFWRPLLCLRSNSGQNIDCELVIVSDESLAFKFPLVLYSFLPSGSL